jgi:PAS domain S-box-containing protein
VVDSTARHPAARGGLARLWQAHPSIEGAAAQRRARVAAGVLLCLLAVGLAALATMPFSGSDPSGALLLVATLAGIAACYALVRRGHVTAGSLLALAAVEGVVWLSRLDVLLHAEGQALLFYLGIPLLMAGLLLPLRSAVAVALATLASAWLLEALIDNRLGGSLDAEDLRLLVFLAAVAALAVAASAIMQRDARQLDESAAQFRQLTENLPEVFFIVSPDLSRAHYVSPAYERVWGRSAAQAMADPLDWLKGVHPDDLPGVQAALGNPPPEGLEFRVVQPAGAIRHIRSRTFPVRDARGATTRLVGISEDITEARLAGERLREANAKLKAAATERQRMFQQIAHDLANPLNPIILHLAILERPGADPAKSLPVMRRSVDALRRQVDDLRDLARVEGGGVRLQVAPTDLAELVAETAASLEANAREKGVTLVADRAGPVLVEADSARLLQVLHNLLGNAIKFTPAGGRVTVRCQTSGDAAEVAVQDSGRGLGPEEAARLFRPFAQVHAPGEVAERGIGLGLFISKGLVEAHGGRIWVESEGRGKGSTFAFQVPRRAAGAGGLRGG